MSIPRSKSRSSTFRSDSGNRTYIITTSRITSGDEWKYRNGLSDFGLLITVGYHRSALAASIPLTMPRPDMTALLARFDRRSPRLAQADRDHSAQRLKKKGQGLPLLRAPSENGGLDRVEDIVDGNTEPRVREQGMGGQLLEI